MGSSLPLTLSPQISPRRNRLRISQGKQIDADYLIGHRRTQTDTDVLAERPQLNSPSELNWAGLLGQKWSSLREKKANIGYSAKMGWADGGEDSEYFSW